MTADAAAADSLRTQACALDEADGKGVATEALIRPPMEEEGSREQCEGDGDNAREAASECHDDQSPDGTGGMMTQQEPETQASPENCEPEMDEELMDAIEGVLRLKRLLSREFDGDEQARKKAKADIDPRSAAQDVKISQLLNKWGLSQDSLTRHVLENLSLPELQHLITSNYSPDIHNLWKSPAELLQTHSNQVRESKGPGGGPLDVVSAFKFKWKLDVLTERMLRGLFHKDLRYVLKHFDGTVPMEKVVADAKEMPPPEEDGLAVSQVPEGPGVQCFSRFGRMELIDPLADAAVFGDANLSFALNLARLRKELGHVGRVIATTFENLDTLQERYKEIGATIATLDEHFAEVHHAVDCTRIAVDDRFSGMQGSFGAVYYNYPHAGAVAGFFDGHPVVNWRHENLMRLFFRALRNFAKPGCVVKVASNAGAVGVRFSYIVGSAQQNEFEHSETFPFQQWFLHRYGRSYGDRRDTYKRPGEGEQYNAQRADSDMVYVFKYRPSGVPLPRQQIRLPPAFKTMLGCTDGALGERTGESKRKLANELFKRFMQECSGIHVG